ncbi:MAG: hypothetical protein JNM40_21555 [Myxococcales bacterium]|nr:hypothetical protein [Myxococcales bacterium]
MEFSPCPPWASRAPLVAYLLPRCLDSAACHVDPVDVVPLPLLPQRLNQLIKALKFCVREADRDLVGSFFRRRL